jgi:hypothetical protein
VCRASAPRGILEKISKSFEVFFGKGGNKYQEVSSNQLVNSMQTWERRISYQKSCLNECSIRGGEVAWRLITGPPDWWKLALMAKYFGSSRSKVLMILFLQSMALLFGNF